MSRLRKALLATLPVLVLLVWTLWPRPHVEGVKLLVFGFDGATFERIDPMVARGELPALARLESRGVRATLRSMQPMYSPLLWTVIASGRLPEETGIKGFSTRATDCRTPRFWDWASQAGWRVGVYKWLVTWPPRKLDGFMVPAWLARGPETWPPELSFVKELELANRLRHKKQAAHHSLPALVVASLRHGLRLRTLGQAAGWMVESTITHPDPDREFLALQELRGQIDRDVFIWSLRHWSPQLATFTWYNVDAVGHRLWDEPALDDAYRQGDQVLGELMDLMGPETTVVVLSDHGFRALNPGEENPYFQPLTERLQERLSAIAGPVEVLRQGARLHVMADPGRSGEITEVIGALIDQDGTPFYRIESLSPGILGLTLQMAELSDSLIARGTVGGDPMDRYVRMNPEITGEHDERGIFLATGPEVPEGIHLDDANLVDMAPTLLALMGLPPPSDMPGRVIVGPRERSDPVDEAAMVGTFEYIGGHGDEGVVEDRLRGLGYVE